MEKCSKLCDVKDYLSISQLEERLKYCVAVMHSFGLIHKDIKPDNLLVNTQGEIVLADFNISTPSAAKPGEKMFTYREGTPQFMSPSMTALNKHSCGLVDLYYNDLWGLKKSLSVISANWADMSSTKYRQPRETDEIIIAISELSNILEGSLK